MTTKNQSRSNASVPENNSPVDTKRRQFLAGASSAAVAAAAASASSAFAQEDSTQPAKEFAGRSAFITGGARGIGFATAKVLAEAGADIVLYDIAEQIDLVPYPLATKEELAAAREEIESLGVRCVAVKGDVRDGVRQKDVMNRIFEEYGSLDIVIANAGITQPPTLDMLSDEEVALMLDINLAGVIKTLQGAIPIMRQQNSGRIVLMSSATGRTGTAFFPVYSATKWALIGLAKGTAQLLGPHNVTVNAVCPDAVNTPLLVNDYILNLLSSQNPTFEAMDEVIRQVHPLPVGLFDPVHVGNTIRFICSDAARYISGDAFDIQAGANLTNTA